MTYDIIELKILAEALALLRTDIINTLADELADDSCTDQTAKTMRIKYDAVIELEARIQKSQQSLENDYMPKWESYK